MRDEILRNPPGRLQVALVLRVHIRQRKAVQAPRLTARPARAQRIALAGDLAHARARLRIKLYDVRHGAVFAHELA